MSEFTNDAKKMLELVGGRENIFYALRDQDEICTGR